MIVSKKKSFDAAHWLPEYDGPCNNMHGHHWVIEVGLEGEVKSDGMVLDFTILKKFLNLIHDTFDHKVINKIIENPTAENITLYINEKLMDWFPEEFLLSRFSLHHIKVWETEDSYVELLG